MWSGASSTKYSWWKPTGWPFYHTIRTRARSWSEWSWTMGCSSSITFTSSITFIARSWDPWLIIIDWKSDFFKYVEMDADGSRPLPAVIRVAFCPAVRDYFIWKCKLLIQIVANPRGTIGGRTVRKESREATNFTAVKWFHWTMVNKAKLNDDVLVDFWWLVWLFRSMNESNHRTQGYAVLQKQYYGIWGSSMSSLHFMMRTDRTNSIRSTSVCFHHTSCSCTHIFNIIRLISLDCLHV